MQGGSISADHFDRTDHLGSRYRRVLARRRRQLGGRRIALFAALAAAFAYAGLAASPPGGAATVGPTVVERWVGTFPGLDGKTPGPRSIVVHFPHPTKPGDLLVAGVDDGVETSGMVHAHYLFPGWRQAVTTIGGETANTGTGGYATGGLQAAIFYYPDNPGGISTVRVAQIPKATRDWVSVVLVELAGVPGNLSVDTTGASTSGPTVGDYSEVSAVRTSRATAEPDELAVAVFNNGGNSAHGDSFANSPGWTVVGEVDDPNNDQQPILLDYRVAPQRTVVTETDDYGGYRIDNCAVVAAFRT